MEIKQDAATIKKAMVQINALAGSGAAQDANQCTRWIMTKEDHCDKIIKTTSESVRRRAGRATACRAPGETRARRYMLAQRVKPASFANKCDYTEALIAHHALLQAAMKAKQTVDVTHCDALDHAIDDVGAMYLKH